jgi:CubicO group peptidase (beta-lactamase class C family)
MRKQKAPGVSLAVLRHGQIVHGRGYGYSNIEHQVPVKSETIFQSGSVGKQFTSMAIMMLVEKGEIELDDKINKFFTDAPIEWNNITVRHLLTHTAGMTDYPTDFDFRADYTEDDLYRIITTIPLTFQPGEQWNYSNLGYVMLGILIRRATNQFYGDFLKEFIFNPLEMTTAQVINEADIIQNRASGYVLVNNEVKNQGWVSPTVNTGADGSLYLTIYDMVKWDAALYDVKLLKNQTSFDIMWSCVKLNNNQTHPYGFGWRLAEAMNGMRIIFHGGAWQGFRSSIIRVPDNKLTVVLFANLDHVSATELAQHVLEMYNPQLAIKPIEDKIQQSIIQSD